MIIQKIAPLIVPKQTSTELLPTVSPVTVPNLIYFNYDHSNSAKCILRSSSQPSCTYTLVFNWKQLGDYLDQSCEMLVFHVDMVTNTSRTTLIEFIDAIQTISRFSAGLENLRIGVVIKKDTPLSIVRDLQKSSVHGLLLDIQDYSVEGALTATQALIDGVPHWPKDIIKKLPGQTRKAVVKSGEIKLTKRQQQVLDLIHERGASNKVIARLLGISESTVKLHVTEIFKKYGVRTRTQLVVFTRDKKE